MVELLPQALKIAQLFFLGDREFADPVVAERTLEFLIANKTKILSCFPTLIPQVPYIRNDQIAIPYIARWMFSCKSQM